MLKKILALILSSMILLSGTATVFAATNSNNGYNYLSEVMKTANDLGIMQTNKYVPKKAQWIQRILQKKY